MTTLEHSAGLNEIRDRLETVELRRRTVRLFTGLAAIVMFLASGLLLAALVAGYWQAPPPVWLRAGLFIVLAAAWVGAAWWFIVRELTARQNQAQVARFVEQAIPDLHNGLINSVLLARDTQQASQELVRHAIDEAAGESRSVDLARSVSLRPLRRWSVAAVSACGLLVAFAALQTEAFWRGLTAVMAPAQSMIALDDLSPGDGSVPLGNDVRIKAWVSNPHGWPVRGAVVFPDGKTEPMAANRDHTVFSASLGPATKRTRYAVRIGRRRWPRQAEGYFTVNVNVPLVRLTPRDATVFSGQPVTLKAEIRNPAGRPVEATVVFDNGDAERMVPAGGHTIFSLIRNDVKQSFRYAVEICGSRWPTDKPFYEVSVIKNVTLENIALNYDYPAYTGRADRTAPRRDPADTSVIAVPQGTRLTVMGHLTGPGRQVTIETRGGKTVAMEPWPGHKVFTATIPVIADGGFRLIVGDGRGAKRAYPESTDPVPTYYRIHAVPDKEPAVRFVAPNRDVSAAPGETVRLRFTATDDYGLSSVDLLAGLEKAKPARVHAWQQGLKARGVYEFDYVVDKGLPDDRGLVIVYHATATDTRNVGAKMGPQTTASAKYKIRVENQGKVAAERARRHEELRRRLMALLKMQLPQRVNTGLCLQRHKRLVTLTSEKGAAGTIAEITAEIKKVSAEIHTVQGKIKGDMVNLVKTFPFDAEMATIQQALALLSANEAHTAIEQARIYADILTGQGKPGPDLATRRDQAAQALGRTQLKVIRTLEMLLAIMPALARKDAEKPQPDGADMPAEVREKLEKLTTELEKFIEAEKKAIEATKRLVKKPVDTFTEDDEKLLKDLIATQDKWEKFLNESFADFSKLAEQDFSNPAMLKELLSVKNDVTMAKDALAKKATEIATPAEENAAKTVAEQEMDNIEKWLPDEPDRVKWSMEDPAGGQKNDEMTELPTELEDLVGDLLEEEEDLFDDMADLSAKSSTSGEKGLGWDALDGPISSMAAKGVTGNQLPNPSEISGRSGEGRTGKSTGEFVEDKAVGKGGRRTPTRLTPEPFQKGQVDDKSTEPPGGATGGGKFSGSGAEGLEGPVPPEIAKELKRMAGKQAQLVNRAERIRSRFKVGDYSNFKLLQAITLMDRVRDDLERYRFHNALRARKDTVGAIRQTQMMLSGKVDITVDATSAMPKYIRDDIHDARSRKYPAEYRGALEQYYRKISGE